MFTFWFLLDILAIVTTFGVGIALNMIFRQWWVSILLFVLLSVYVYVKVGIGLNLGEWILFAVSFLGVLLSVWGIVALKKSGYSMFSR